MCASGASTVTAVSSADGDPSPAGEINAIGQVMAADGDPFNEIDQINQAYGMTTRQINHLKELNIYNQFNTVNRYTNVSELKTTMFNMRIDYEMIASSGAPQWQYTSGLLKYTLERGLTSELYQELIAINPYFVEVLEPIVKSGG